MQRLPVDISTFSRIRELNCVYVDKTRYMYHMITGGQRYFLSRPRRFGKSLLVSTLKEILTGKKHLFDGLWIHQSDYHWQEHGVINLDFSKIDAESVDSISYRLRDMLISVARNYNLLVDASITLPDVLLEKIVIELFKKYGRAAILVDEYDAPILKTLHDKELAKTVRGKIQQFFTTIKSLDEQIQFVFITGVSSFAKAGLFSGINNLQVITLRDEYAAICGYTDAEIDRYFTDHITDWAQKSGMSYEDLREQVKSWYNGYSFGYNIDKVYNPFSVMNALEVKKFKNFWFTSGAPTFLIDILKTEYRKFDPDRLETTEDMLGVFDVNVIPVISLMFQTGYLTVVGYNAETDLYRLDYPNLEVKKAFQKYLLEVFAHIEHSYAQDLSAQLHSVFSENNIEGVVDILKQLFAHVPYQLHTKEEKFYHALLMMICVGAGIKAQSEYSTSHGRIDLMMEFSRYVYIVEIKFNQSAQNALDQIEERQYYQRFLSTGKQIILLGLSFKREPHSFDIEYVQKRL